MDRPLLMFPRIKGPLPREKRKQPVGDQRLPSAARQQERLGEQLARLVDGLKTASLQQTAVGGTPGKVLVVEVAGSESAFVQSASRLSKKVRGLQWLAEWADDNIDADDDFFTVDKAGNRLDRPLAKRLYLMAASQEGLAGLLRLWDRWQAGAGQALAPPYGAFQDFFRSIVTIRWWNHHDRLDESGLVEAWRLDLANRPNESVLCEIEAWSAGALSVDTELRRAAKQAVVAVGGTVKRELLIPEIHYNGLLIEVPADVAAQLIAARDASLFWNCDSVMYFRAVGQSVGLSPEADVGSPTLPDAVSLPEPTSGLSPNVAMFDGLPVQNHRLLAGRLRIDNFLDLNPPVEQRWHGTAVASVLLHGNVESPAPLSRPVHVVPILEPGREAEGSETLPRSRLVLDVFRQAVERTVIGDGTAQRPLGTVRVVNLSVANPHQPYLGTPSPWARLLDWLAVQHNLLFIVAAGNTEGRHRRELNLATDEAAWRDLDARSRRKLVLRHYLAEHRHRGLFAPAEAVNALTVGALHEDVGTQTGPRGRLVDISQGGAMPAPYSAMGPGAGLSVKPDLLLPGGRLLYQDPIRSGPPWVLRPGRGSFRFAVPRQPAGRDIGSGYGTSYAAPQATRAAAAILDVLSKLPDPPEGGIRPDDAKFAAIATRALLVHGASWAGMREEAYSALQDAGQSPITSTKIARLLGYGRPDVEPVLECTATRATVIGLGAIHLDQAHHYQLPVPPDLLHSTNWRRLVVTLAWFTPIRPANRKYRAAKLDAALDPAVLGIESVAADDRAGGRGTVEHRIYEGRKDQPDQVQFLEIRVNCRADPGLDASDTIRYALIVTLEAREDIGIQVYEHVKQALRVKPAVRPQVRP